MIQTQAISANFNGSGSTGPFTFNFRFFDNEHIYVKKNVGGVLTDLEQGSDFTVTGAGSDTGGAVTLAVALNTGESITIYRFMPVLQLTHLADFGPFFASTVEAAFDYMTMLIQQQMALIVGTDGNRYQLNIVDNGDGTFMPTFTRIF